MRARALQLAELAPDGPDPRMPAELVGWVALGVAEVLTDAGAHQAYGLVLGAPNARSPRKLVLWWQREPSRRWVLTPID